MIEPLAVDVDATAVVGQLETLSRFSDAEGEGIRRIVFSPCDMEARSWFRSECAKAELELRTDPVGNTFARWQGSEPGLPAVATGSHIDAIPNSGMYDGTVGVLGGLAAISALKRAGFEPRRSVELILFTSEEPTRFGIGCLGSRLMSGSLNPAHADGLSDRYGATLRDVRTAAGFEGPLESVRLPEGYYSAFVELHIEQGPLLEQERIPVGVVTHIAAPASLRMVIEGEGGHAGAVLMRERRDALVAAAEIITGVESAALATGAEDTVATVGICDVYPGAVNGIPSRVTLGLDVRDIDEARRNSVLERIARLQQAVSRRRGISIGAETLNADAPATCDEAVIRALSESCRRTDTSYREMVSRAYHDSLFMARITPVAMLFIPCRNGVSHRPDEYASPEAIGTGIKVLAGALAQLASA